MSAHVEVVRFVLEWLDARSIARCARVSKLWNAASTDQFWRSLCKQRYNAQIDEGTLCKQYVAQRAVIEHLGCRHLSFAEACERVLRLCPDEKTQMKITQSIILQRTLLSKAQEALLKRSQLLSEKLKSLLNNLHILTIFRQNYTDGEKYRVAIDCRFVIFLPSNGLPIYFRGVFECFGYRGEEEALFCIEYDTQLSTIDTIVSNIQFFKDFRAMREFQHLTNVNIPFKTTEFYKPPSSTGAEGVDVNKKLTKRKSGRLAKQQKINGRVPKSMSMKVTITKAVI